YYNNNKTIRISYGFYTIQIWKIKSDKNNKNDKDDKDDKDEELIHIYCVTSQEIRKEPLKPTSQVIQEEVEKFFTKEHAIDAYNSLIFFHNLKKSKIPYKKLKV